MALFSRSEIIGKVINKTVYLCVGLNKNDFKEVLGIWVGKTESSSFWMGVLTDLKARGVEDILITVTDNLNGFTDTIKAVFPESTTQICIVHQIRNSCRYVVWKEKKEFTSDLKLIYNMSRPNIVLHKKSNIMEELGNECVKRTQKDYSLSFKLSVVREV